MVRVGDWLGCVRLSRLIDVRGEGTWHAAAEAIVVPYVRPSE